MGFLLSGAEGRGGVGLDTHANDVGIRVENGESKIWVDMASVVVQLFTAHEPTTEVDSNQPMRNRPLSLQSICHTEFMPG